MVTKICEFQHKIGYNSGYSACVRDNPDTCTQWGVVRVTQFNDVLEITSRTNQMIVFEHKIGYNFSNIIDIAENLA